MYKSDNNQIKFEDFKQPVGLNMDPNNRWIKKATQIPWDKIENEYEKFVSNNKGIPMKYFRPVLGALIIQKIVNISDKEVVLSIAENPYMQYFIGLPGYEVAEPFDSSLLNDFRKSLDPDIMKIFKKRITDLMKDESYNTDTSTDSFK